MQNRAGGADKVVSKSPSRKAVEHKECNNGHHDSDVSLESGEMEELLQEAVNQHIEAKQLPNELVINAPVVSTSSKTEESDLTGA